MSIVGIDPGVSGALVWLNPLGTIDGVMDMPVAPTGTNARNEVQGRALTLLFQERYPDMVVLEQIGARPGEGAVQSFNFGQAFGVVIGVTAALEIPLTRVRPNIWKQAMKIHGKGKKGAEAARARAMELWPKQDAMFRRVKDHGRADAALIALGHMKGLY